MSNKKEIETNNNNKEPAGSCVKTKRPNKHLVKKALLSNCQK